ncbi:hypothetical protein JR316_0011875 [Psilocybe cubensis]|uniref:Uncharacterized protein n=2 Tax=Psilocybe cubensis TaxID=181762 RepID=A0ACB8GKU8_PSICU|nr:hypothetical protein JR316_0011875 [Psilocybe cubensis]KAH9476301.1 hypothetical protein JR316_0011875 [Psilocybe cubensis]
MTDYYETRQPYRGDLAAEEDAMRRTMTRGSHQSQASVSTGSWVAQNQLYPPGPPPESSRFSADLTPLRAPRPLPVPESQLYQSRTAFQYAGTQEEEEDYMTAQPHPERQFAYRQQHDDVQRRDEANMNVIPLPTSPTPGSPLSSPKARPGRSLMGGFFSGLKRLPKLVLKGGGEEKRQLKHKGTFNTDEGTSTSVTGMTRGNTLPRYLSNPSIRPSNPQFAHRLSMAVANGSLPPGSTPATVYHLRTNTAGPQFPIVTITPASGSEGIAEEEQAHFYDGPPGIEPHQSMYREDAEYDRHRLNDRTTVMMYNTDSQAPSRTQSASVPPPPRQPTPGPRVSYQTQLPTRANRQGSQTEQGPSNGPVNAAPSAHTGILNNTTQPSAAMTNSMMPGDVLSSPRSPSSYTISAVPSLYDPSFASDLTPIEKFFKGLYNLPWIAQERVTIDYRPGDSDRARAKVKAMKKTKPMASWYRAVMSRRGSRDLDLLSSGSPSSPRTTMSFGNTLSPIESPISRETGRWQNLGAHNHSKSKRHRQKRHRGTWSTMRSGEDATGRENVPYMPQRSTSPIIPTMYPYAYPGHPAYAPYTAYGIPAAYPAPMPVPHTVPRGPRKHRSKSKMHSNKYHYGYPPYQPMTLPPVGAMGPPPIYYIAPSPPQNQTTMPSDPNMTQTQTQSPPVQGHPPPPGTLQVSPVIMHFVPGAFGNQNQNHNLNPRDPAMLSPPLTPQRQRGYDS